MKNYTPFFVCMFCFLLFTNAQSISKFSIDSGGASVSTSSLQVLCTIGEVNVGEVTSISVIVSEGFINPSVTLSIILDPIVFLQGALINSNSTVLMTDDLRSNGLLPTSSPYIDNAIVSNSVFNTTGNNAIVDWVFIELRASNNNTNIVASTSALLQRDGDVVGLDGTSSVQLNVPPNDYYVSVKHRNHLGVMSANTFLLEENSTTIVDFTDSTFPSFGSNAQIQTSTGITALWTGNTNMDNIVQYSGTSADAPSILSYVLNDTLNFLNFPTFNSTGYNDNDLNLDGNIQYSGTAPDTPLLLQNVLTHPGNFLNFSTYQILEQLPEN